MDIDVHVSNRGPDRARNEIIEQFLSSKGMRSQADKLWLLDRDVVPPSHKPTIYSFLTADYPVVSGVTDIFSGTESYKQVYKLTENGTYITQSPDKWPKSDLFVTDAVGAGCLCLSRALLEWMPKPWFEFDGEYGEDLNFCRKTGHKIVVYQKMACRHYKTVDLSSIVSSASQKCLGT
mgnify:FL=1